MKVVANGMPTQMSKIFGHKKRSQLSATVTMKIGEKLIDFIQPQPLMNSSVHGIKIHVITTKFIHTNI